jgi:hypothetical protein
VSNPEYVGSNPCVYGCGKKSSHYTLYVCDNKRMSGRCDAATPAEADRLFLKSCGIAVEPSSVRAPARGVVNTEIVMQGEAVRTARELHAIRKRKPLMGERRATACGELDLGEIL